MRTSNVEAPAHPTALGHWYDVVDRVGVGAAAVVYRVRDRRDGVVRAAKVLRGEMAGNEETVRRFENEYRILHRLHHPSLPEVSDYGWLRDGSRYMVMELVEGEPLDAHLRDHPEDLWGILYQLCEVLSFIHSHDLLHQDFKPGNVLVRRTSAYGEAMPLVTLIDFGLTYRRGVGESSAMVGTLEYMAPEVITGEAVLTRAVDYYGLGVTLYQLVQGRLPFAGDARAVMEGHLRGEVVFGEERIEYAEIYPHIRGLMGKRVRERLESFEGFRQAVVGRMTGGIEELEKAYGLARINSLGMVGKGDVWTRVEEWLWDLSNEPSADVAPTEDRASIGRVLLLAGHPASGRSYVARRVADEGRVRGMPVLNASAKGELEAFVMRGKGDMPRAWSTLTEGVVEPPVVIVDARGKLTDPERDLLGFLQARALSQTGSEARFGLLVLSSGAEDGALPVDLEFFDVRREMIPNPGEEDRGALWETIRPSILSTDEAEVLRAALLQSSGTAGALVGMLRSAVQRDALLFRGGRFVCTKDVGKSFEVEEDSEPYTELIEALPRHEREVVFALSCHPEPVAPDRLAAVVGVDRSAVDAAIEHASQLEMLRQTPRGVEMAGDALRDAAYQMIPRGQKEGLHRRFVSIFERDASGESEMKAAAVLCHHYESLGDVRTAFLCHAPTLRRLRDRLDDDTLRTECKRGLDFCNRVDDAGEQYSTILLRRFYAKELIARESSSGRGYRVRAVVDEYFVERQLRIPPAVVERYSLALMRVKREDTTMIDEALRTVAYPYSEVGLALKLEKARILTDTGLRDQSLPILTEVGQHLHRLKPRHAARLFLYRMIGHVQVASYNAHLDDARQGESITIENGLWDEYVAFRLIRGAALYQNGNFAEAVRVVGQATRVSHRHGLAFRRAQLYFLASAIYYAAGDYERSLRYLDRASRVAEGMGETGLVGRYLSRFVMIYHSLGLLGNASRYAVRSVLISDRSTSFFESVAAHAALCETQVLMHSRHARAAVESLQKSVVGQLNATRMSHYLIARGDFFMEQARYAEAVGSYSEARELNESAGVDDDAFQALVRQVRASLRIRDESSRNELRSLLESAPVSTMSLPLQGEYRTTWILLMREIGTAEEIRAACRTGETVREELTNVIVGKDLDRVLFEAWIEVGDVERAKAAFGRYYAAFKMMVSNLESSAVDEFCRGEGIDEIVARYRVLT